MATYYTILYATIRPDISEKLSVGLLFVSQNKIYLKISHTKLNLLKHLFPLGPFNSLKNSLKNIESKLKSYDSANCIENTLGIKEKIEAKEFSLSYIEYLSNYNNNILTFSKPNIIDINLDKNLFNLFYKKFIDDSVEKIELIKPFSVFRNNFITEVKSHFNVEQKITSKEIPALIAPLKFDLVGKNEIEVFAQFIDIEKATYITSNEINTMYSIKDAVPNSKRYIVSEEPNKTKFPEQYALWLNLKKADLFEYLHTDDAEKIKIYAEEHDVKPLFDVA